MLKTIITLLTVVSVFTTASAQETEGHVSYSVEFSSKQPEMQMQIGMLQGSKMDIYFTEGKSRTEFNVGTIMKTVTVINTKTEKMLTLMSGMMGNKAVTDKVEKREETKKPTVELLDETKEIAGYTCKKAILTDADGNSYDLWYTDKIKASTEGQKYFGGDLIPGFPMQMQISQNGMDIKMTATAFEKLPKKNTYFDMTIPEGYQTMTQEELGKMMGGM